MRDLAQRLWGLLGLGRRRVAEAQVPLPGRGPTDHVILIDGTMSTLEPGQETSIGLLYRTLRAVPQSARMSIYYEPGVQWRSWRDARDVAMGKGINRQIQRAYGWLATRYRPGDRIFLFGFSRGAFAVRSLAGIIDRVGLLTEEEATERNVRLTYRYYRRADPSPIRDVFVRRYCHPKVEIEMVGVFDTVKALGVRLPFLWMWTEPQHDFHNFALGPHIRHGYQALALDETRAAYDPILWQTPEGDSPEHIEQVWFRGTHGDIGGHVGDFTAARPLANIPLVWMLEKAEARGLPLPADWRGDFPTDPEARSVGSWRGWGKVFWLRARRRIGADPSETIHPSARARSRAARRALAQHVREV